MYSGPSCPDSPFSVELVDAEINTLIWGRGGGVLAYGADLIFGSGPVPLREGVDDPWVSPLEFTFVYLHQFLLLNTCMFMCRVSGMHAVPCGGGSPYLRTQQGGRPTVPTLNGCGYGGKGDELGVPPAQRRGRGGRTLPPSMNPQEVTMKSRMKARIRGM
jgi:hypothetical protein